MTGQTNWPELHRLNRVWRLWMDKHSEFVTPDIIDTLRYASEECHEARKCWMVERNPNHPRRQQPDKTICQELAQATMLALTALPDINFRVAETDRLYVSDLLAIDNICSLAGKAVEEEALGFEYWQDYTHAVLLAIASWPDLNIDAELRQCWWALAWKHASYHMSQYPVELQAVEVADVRN